MSDQSEILEKINLHLKEMIKTAPPVIKHAEAKEVIHPTMERLNKSMVAQSDVFGLLETLRSKDIIGNKNVMALQMKIMAMLEEEITNSCRG